MTALNQAQRRPSALGLAFGVGLVVLGLALLTTRGSLGGGQDEELPFLVTQTLCRTGRTWLDESQMAGVRASVSQWTDAVRQGRDGRWWVVFGPAQSITAVPLYAAAGLTTAGQSQAEARATLVRWCCALNPLLVAWCAGLVCWWLLALWPERRRLAACAGLASVVCTPLWPYAKTFMAEPLSAACFLTAAHAAWRARRDDSSRAALLGGLALAWAMVARPHNLILWPALAGLAGWPRAGRRHLAFSLLPAAVALWWLWFNALRFGRPTDFGYLAAVQGDFRLAGLPLGVVGQLLSTGRGLLWFAPPVVLCGWGWRELRRRDGALAGCLLAACLTPLLFYGARGNWWGSWCWGPRYLVPVLPLLAVLAAAGAERAPRWLVRGSLAAGLVAALAGVVTYNGLYQAAVQQRDGTLTRLLWSPLDSPLVGHWLMLRRVPADLLCWHLLRVDPALGLAHGILRGVPALVGGWLWRRSSEGSAS